MTAPRSERLYLHDILQAIDKILAYTAPGRDALMADVKTQDAVVRNLEVIGEAAKGLPEEIRAAHPDVPWTQMARTRDRCIHHYFRVDLDVVWQIVSEDLPPLRAQIAALLAS